jgi:hypothetical protein
VYLAVKKGVPMVVSVSKRCDGLCQLVYYIFKLQEVPVQWQEMSGSKLDIVSATIQMARDIIVIRLCYMLGIWSDAAPQLRAPVTKTVAPQVASGAPEPSATFERR